VAEEVFASLIVAWLTVLAGGLLCCINPDLPSVLDATKEGFGANGLWSFFTPDEFSAVEGVAILVVRPSVFIVVFIAFWYC
jgi:hypothetical protein